MRLHTGVTFDPTGYPVGAVTLDEGPSRPFTDTPSYAGRLVVGRSGARVREEGEQSADAIRIRRFRERHGGRRAR